MAYRQTYKRFYRKRNNNTRAIAYKALKIAKYVKHKTTDETKKYIINTAPVPVPSTGVILDLTSNMTGYGGIVQGTGENDRVGDNINLARITFRGLANRNTAGPNVQGIRAILFQGKGENSNVPLVSDFLEFVNVYSGKNVYNKYNSKVIWDKNIWLDDVNKQYYEFDWNFKLNQRVTFDSIGSIANGGLWLLLIGTHVTAGQQPLWNGVFQISYNDE